MRTVEIAGIGNVVGALIGVAAGFFAGGLLAAWLLPRGDMGSVFMIGYIGIACGVVTAPVTGAIRAGMQLQRAGANAVGETTLAILALNLVGLLILVVAMGSDSINVYGPAEAIFPIASLIYLGTIPPTCACALAGRQSGSTAPPEAS